MAAANGRVLGHLEAVLSVRFLPVVTSFEMNEHLAATDTSLPLYPGPGQAPRRIIPEGAEEPESTVDTIEHVEQEQQPQHKRSEPAPPSTDVFAKLGEFLDRRHSRWVGPRTCAGDTVVGDTCASPAGGLTCVQAAGDVP